MHLHLVSVESSRVGTLRGFCASITLHLPQVFAELIPDALESLSASATGHIVTISVATMVGLQLVLENAVH
jgi:hypothetical protein